MSWTTENLTGTNTALTTTAAAISKRFLNRSPEYMVIEVTTGDAYTGDLYLFDSSDGGTTWNQVATVAVNAASNTVWRLDARTTPIRNMCEVRMKLDAGGGDSGGNTGTVSSVYITWSP